LTRVYLSFTIVVLDPILSGFNRLAVATS
jgi:hypothetical protein